MSDAAGPPDPRLTAGSATAAQLHMLQAVASGRVPVWVVIYPDGQWCVRRDTEAALQHARDRHGVVVEYGPRAGPV